MFICVHLWPFTVPTYSTSTRKSPEPLTPHPDNPARGALFVIAAALLFASMGATIRLLSRELDNESIVFFRNLFGLLVLLPWLWKHGLGRLRTQHFPLHLVRSLSGLAAMYCFFYAISKLPLSEAVLLNFSAPLFIPFIAAFWLAEAVAPRVAWAIGIGFIGVVLIMKPGLGLASGAALIGLASGAFAALAMVTLRRLSQSEPSGRVVFLDGVICNSVSAVPMIWAGHLPRPDLLLLLALTGLLATLGQLLLTRGYRYAPAAQIGPFTYTSVLFAAAYGWWFWGETPDTISFAGTLLIVAASILAMRREGGVARPISGQ